MYNFKGGHLPDGLYLERYSINFGCVTVTEPMALFLKLVKYDFFYLTSLLFCTFSSWSII